MRVIPSTNNCISVGNRVLVGSVPGVTSQCYEPCIWGPVLFHQSTHRSLVFTAWWRVTDDCSELEDALQCCFTVKGKTKSPTVSARVVVQARCRIYHRTPGPLIWYRPKLPGLFKEPRGRKPGAWMARWVKIQSDLKSASRYFSSCRVQASLTFRLRGNWYFIGQTAPIKIVSASLIWSSRARPPTRPGLWDTVAHVFRQRKGLAHRIPRS